jgi:hypothetical protein
VCGRFLPADEDGVIVHDDIPHPPEMDFADEEKRQILLDDPIDWIKAIEAKLKEKNT